MDKIHTTSLTGPDGTRVEYEHTLGFIPQGTLSVPFGPHFDVILPGANALHAGTLDCVEIAPNLFESRGRLSLGKQEKGADGAWRVTRWVECAWTIVSDYRSFPTR